ncbi:photosystem I P700 apoprotein A2, chloroplast [Artemisia annua]|uniref:Photosystem I P700 apoprotein A2, chloroplast n=1 Tax=Artemisia annua TaxID=35608 RepID=A0A2U1LB24_ARTAN|nr:photosystem I P700 apoprotein A2, chloroplast [Artemisia annua]
MELAIEQPNIFRPALVVWMEDEGRTPSLRNQSSIISNKSFSSLVNLPRAIVISFPTQDDKARLICNYRGEILNSDDPFTLPRTDTCTECSYGKVDSWVWNLGGCSEKSFLSRPLRGGAGTPARITGDSYKNGGEEDLKGIMALRFPRFSQGLAQDPTTRRIWFGIATAHDFESHDDITEERLYQNIFASHFGQLAIIFLWTSGMLFHVAWQGNSLRRYIPFKA